jgi:predicted TIM-barrel fold metal-dependent hydrolase
VKIDFHAHIWSNQTDADVDNFIKAMDQRGIDKVVILPIAPYVSNEEIAARVRRHPDRLIGFASVMPFSETTGIPRTDPAQELERAARDLGLKGLKLHPTMQGFSLDDPGLVPLMQKAAELKFPVLFHTGPTHGRAGRLKHALIEHVDDLAIMCPNTIIVAGHGDILDYGPYIAAKHPNVYLDTAITWARMCNLIPGLGEAAIRQASARKILFGTDANPGRIERFDDTLSVLNALDVTEEVRATILGGNAARLLGLQS